MSSLLVIAASLTVRYGVLQLIRLKCLHLICMSSCDSGDFCLPPIAVPLPILFSSALLCSRSVQHRIRASSDFFLVAVLCSTRDCTCARSLPPSTDVYLVLELQYAMSAFGAQLQQGPAAAPETRAWARMRLFDMNGHLFADRWRLPLREMPIQPLLDERNYLNIQTVSSSLLTTHTLLYSTLLYTSTHIMYSQGSDSTPARALVQTSF